MNQERRHFTIQTLDNSPRVLFWTIEEFLCLAVPVFIGLCFGYIFLVPIGLFIKPIYSKMTKRMPRGALNHRLYWLFPTKSLIKMGIVKNMPQSHYREFIL